ncbi:MAG: TRAP transporter permease [Alphaproteobacteria bacterium]|nr:TRAP transporter permease [Alphaproteobacteria bacterium]
MNDSHSNAGAQSSAAPDILPDLMDKDIGARNPSGITGKIILVTAVLWSLFQLWIASPFQYQLDFFAINNTEARSIHLAFAMFLAFMVCPAFSRSARNRVPWIDWALALIGAYCAGYIFLEYRELAQRPGYPTTLDIVVSVVGVLLLLEASRRSLGMALVIIAGICLFYTFAGSWEYMPDLIRHDGQSLNKVANHQWLSTEGVFGLPLGVSTSFVFLFVLFGALLEKAGAGNYFIKVAFAMLGHMRGGPAKAAVLSSGLTGLVSGSSIANVVMTGTFTIPLMRRVGFSKEKAGAVEVSSSVNGQIMPPVMGAAAFLMVESTGIPYHEVVKHAFIPAIISYIALLYIVHLEALKMNMQTLPRPHNRTMLQTLLVYGITTSSIVIVAGLVYYGIGWVKNVIPDYSFQFIIAFIAFCYIGLLWYSTRYPELLPDDPKAPILELPKLAPTVKTGLHYLLPLVVLMWCLMIERLSPGLSAFWACFILIIMLLTQRSIVAFFRKHPGAYIRHFFYSIMDLIDGLNIGARNMIGIAIATAAAGIIVGTVTLTGIGQIMTQVVEILSGGSFFLVLLFTAVICLILGMGLPTTANYVVVSSIMVAVIQELGAKHGYYIPIIAIHMFVFYFGIMADVTPPVGLASFAAAAVAGGDPIRTGAQAFLYSCRTVVLPFFFIFNHKLLLIGVDSFLDGFLVFLLFTAAIMLFSAALQGYFLLRSRWYESIALLLISSMLFIPGRWMTLAYPPHKMVSADTLEEVVGDLATGDTLHLLVETDDIGRKKEYFVHIPLEGDTTQARLKALGLELSYDAQGVANVDNTVFNSESEKAGILFDDKILGVRKALPQPPLYSVYMIACLCLFIIVALQFGRMRRKKNKASQGLAMQN